MPVDAAGFRTACVELAGALQTPGRDVYLRATVMAVDGHWGEDTVSDMVAFAYQQDAHTPGAVDLGVSAWRRSPDLALPARVKTGTNYQVGRLARIEGRARGMSEMILLNEAGRVAEATAACVLIVRDGRVITPPAWEGALESITLDVVERICAELSVPFERRPVERTELIVAEEIGLAARSPRCTRARSVDGLELDPAWPVLGRVLDRYRRAVCGIEPLEGLEITTVPLAAPEETSAAGAVGAERVP